MISDIGDSLSSSIRCYSDEEGCCYSTSQRGVLEQWKFPNGSVVPEENSSILVTRDNRYLGLYRIDNATTPVGKYCCEAQDGNGTNRTVCVHIQGQCIHFV